MVNESDSLPTITIIGSGYTGVTSAAVFANIGYKVYTLEINPERLAAIKSGRSFFYEDYINPLLEKAVASGRLIATDSYEEAIPQSDIVFSCVGTPDKPDGSTNLAYVFAAATEAAKHAKAGMVYAQRSTVPVGTGEKVEKLFAGSGAKINYVSNPEFLREGTALIDSLWFSRAVVGGADPNAVESVLNVHRQIAACRDQLCDDFGIPKKDTGEPSYITTSLNSSELIKVSANAFLALKISFANSIAKLADATGSDIIEVMNGIGADKRIGRDFLNAGRGYGGGCFPKDVSGLISSGLEYGVDLDIMHAVSSENDSMPGYILEKTLESFDDESLEGKKATVLGLAFKAGTSDIRKSPAIRIANMLSENMKADVHAYDPQALKDGGRGDLRQDVVLHTDAQSALQDAAIVVVATDWPEFKKNPSELFNNLKPGTVIVDAMNCLDRQQIQDTGLRYVGVGR